MWCPLKTLLAVALLGVEPPTLRRLDQPDRWLREMQHNDAVARAEAAQERWMRWLCQRSFTLVEAAELVDPSAPDAAKVAMCSRQGTLLAFEYGGDLWFPKYQFAGRVALPVIRRLVAVARDAEASDTDLAFWLSSPSSLFAEQNSPADHLDTPERVVEAARIHFEATW